MSPIRQLIHPADPSSLHQYCGVWRALWAPPIPKEEIESLGENPNITIVQEAYPLIQLAGWRAVRFKINEIEN